MYIRNDFPVLVHLRRTRFAAHFIPGHGGIFGAAEADYLFQQITHEGAGFLTDGMTDHLGLRAVKHRAIRRDSLLQQIGLHQPAAVDHRAGCRQQLDRRYSNTLPKTNTRQIHIFHILLSDQNAAGLALQINARSAA